MYTQKQQENPSYVRMHNDKTKDGILNHYGTRLALYIIVVMLVIFVGLGYYIASAALENGREAQQRNCQPLLDAIILNTNQYIEGMDAVGKLLAASRTSEPDENQKNTDGLQSRLVGITKSFSRIKSAVIVDTNKVVLAGVGDDGTKDLRGVTINTEYTRLALQGDPIARSHSLKISGKDAFYTVALPIRNAQNDIMGAVEVVFSFSAFSNIVFNNLNLGKTANLFLLDPEGVILANSTGTQLFTLSPVEKIRNAKTRGSLGAVVNGEPRFITYAPLPAVDWLVGFSISESELMENPVYLRNVIVYSGIVAALLLAISVFLILYRYLQLPLAKLQRFGFEVAEGDYNAWLDGKFICELFNLSLAIRCMRYRFKDDFGFTHGLLQAIGTPCGIVNKDSKMLWVNKELCELLQKEGGPEAQLDLIAGSFYYNDPAHITMSQKAIDEQKPLYGITQTTTRLGKTLDISVATSPFYDLDNNLLGALSFWTDITDLSESRRQVEKQHAALLKMADRALAVAVRLNEAGDELTRQIVTCKGNTREQEHDSALVAQSINDMNTIVLEMAASADSAASMADQAETSVTNSGAIVQTSATSIMGLRAHMQEMAKTLEELGRQADGIDNIINMISDIADQTNLLALNAAIEAARAGEAGRGFAVVADEVRKLAEKTRLATTDVSTAIRSIQEVTVTSVRLMERASTEVDTSVNGSEQVASELNAIVASAHENALIVRNIARISREQTTNSAQITTAAQGIADLSRRTTEAMEQADSVVTRVNSLVEEIHNIVNSLNKTSR